jgi:hypothetical protein
VIDIEALAPSAESVASVVLLALALSGFVWIWMGRGE